eukprot:SAG31_NODE_44968_length_260_cov_1.273292_1_plen_23_part_01
MARGSIQPAAVGRRSAIDRAARG